MKTDKSVFLAVWGSGGGGGGCAVTGGYTRSRQQGHDGLQVDSLVSASYSLPSWDEGMVERWGGRKAEGQHGWQTKLDTDLDQASGRTELQCKNRLVNSPDCIGYMPHMIKVTWINETIWINFIGREQPWHSVIIHCVTSIKQKSICTAVKANSSRD